MKPSPRHNQNPHAAREHWIYGKNPIVEVLRAKRRDVMELQASEDFLNNPKNVELVQMAKAANVRITTLSPQAIGKRVGNDVVHQNVIARVGEYPYQTLGHVCAKLKDHELFLALDEVTDPQNFATLCRSALAFGVSAILLPQDRSVGVTAAVCKASAGGIEHAQVAVVVNMARALEELKEKGFWIYGTTLKEGSQALGKFKPAARSVVVMGSEGKGLRPLVEKTCDMLIHIPMQNDFDSLNVAQAGTVCLYEFARHVS